MKHLELILTLLSFVLLASNGCIEQPLKVQERTSAVVTSSTPIIYSKQIQPIFRDNCNTSGCHEASTSASRLSLESWESLFRGSKSGAVVVSGNATMSHLVQVINNDSTIGPVSFPQMPLSRNSLDREQILLLKRWVDEGGRNDEGELPFSHPRNGKAYITNQSADPIAVIDLESNLLMRYVKLGSQAGGTRLGAPHNVVVDDGGIFYYATLIQSGELWKFRGADDSFVGKINLNISPGHVVVTADGSTAYVTDFKIGASTSGVVKVVDTPSMTERATILMGSQALSPHGARLSHDGRRLYTANTSSSTVTVIQTFDNSVEAIILLDPDSPPGTANLQPFQVAVHPNDRFIYVSCYKFANQTGEVRVIDTASMSVVQIIPVGTRPIQVEVSPNGGYVFACNQGSDDVSVISTTSNAVVATISNLPRQPHGVDFTADGREAFISCENQTDPIPPHHPTIGLRSISFVCVIDVASLKVIKQIEVGGYAAGVSITPGRGN